MCFENSIEIGGKEMRSSNPALPANTFTGFGRGFDQTEEMTMSGTIMKTGLLLLCTMLSAGWTWGLFLRSGGM